jgi:hypothetical protein
MKHNHKIFFAIPFDSATMNLYKRITNQIREIFPTVSTVIGTDEVGHHLNIQLFLHSKHKTVSLLGYLLNKFKVPILLLLI